MRMNGLNVKDVCLITDGGKATYPNPSQWSTEKGARQKGKLFFLAA